MRATEASDGPLPSDIICEPYVKSTPGLVLVWVTTTPEVCSLLWWRIIAIESVKCDKNAVLLSVELLLLTMVTVPL